MMRPKRLVVLSTFAALGIIPIAFRLIDDTERLRLAADSMRESSTSGVEQRDGDVGLESSSGMETRILGEISQMSGLAANLVEVECRAIRCRLRLTLPVTSLPDQPELVAYAEDGPEFVLAEQIGLDTELVLTMGSGPAPRVFLTYLRRPDDSTTLSIAELLADAVN